MVVCDDLTLWRASQAVPGRCRHGRGNPIRTPGNARPSERSLEAAFGRDRLIAALERATAYRRFRAADVRLILAAYDRIPRSQRSKIRRDEIADACP